MFKKRSVEFEPIVWMVIGVFICFFARKAHLGSFREPGPGFLAFAAGLFLCVVGLIMLLSQILSGVPAADRGESTSSVTGMRGSGSLTP